MSNLWAPWRLKYIIDDKKNGCVFCEKLKMHDDPAHFILERGKTHFVILNIYPYNNGHLMIVPNRHIETLEKLSDEEMHESSLLLRKWISLLRKTMNPDGFNCGINIGAPAGAGIKDHVHTHVVPRWQGDTNFMPVVSDTKVIPQSLQDLYALLISELKKWELHNACK